MTVENSAYGARVSPVTSQPSEMLVDAQQAFCSAYVAAVTLDEDRAAAEELAREATPALEALRRWVQMDPAAQDNLLRSEALAMVSLLGRRAARLGISPSAALALVEGLMASVANAGLPLEAAARSLRAVCLEGYVAASAERVQELRASQWVEQQAMVEFVAHGLLLLPSGISEPAQLSELGERFVRALFRHEARVGWMDLSALAEPSAARAGALLGIREGTAMLGCGCVFSGVGPAWQAAFSEACEDPTILILEPSFDAGLSRALGIVAHEVRPHGPLAAALKRLRGR